MIVAAVIAVIAVVAFVMTRSGNQSLPPTGGSQTETPTARPGSTGSGGTLQPTGKLVPVPKGVTLSQYVNNVYTLVRAKKYDQAFKLYPDNVQQGGIDSFKSTRSTMPVIDFKVGSETTQGNKASIQVTQTLGGQAQGSKWIVTWNFKKSKGQWGVEGYDISQGQ